MQSPTPAVGVDSSHPSIPVSHPRTSSRSPTQRNNTVQPPISPPRASKANGNLLATPGSQLTPSSPTPTPTAPNTPIHATVAKAPLTPPDSTLRTAPAPANSNINAFTTPTDGATGAPNVSFASSNSNENSSLQSNHTLATAQSESGLSAASSTDDSFKTPNVYINGLPPNFPEEQLYAMTKEFGGVISVRTFTRHVSDRPSGYGFVLFETVDSAERCIKSLRSFRNLHPSFSKQIHKIPGTSYASLASTNSASSVSGMSSSESADTFKARMERLKDQSSTNLYIEGLPLSIDEATLSALVAPFTIKSSRFFQTRLSHPPRIIAFVRLDSRDACEEVIERLHGRMVRGWNDPGSRISVRFADSAEQRELRRAERSGREDEQSPSRLTMAQAALLNLRGQQIPAPQFRGISASQSLPEVQRHGAPNSFAGPNVTRGRTPAHAGLPLHPLTAEYQSRIDTRSMPTSLSANLANLALNTHLPSSYSTSPNLPSSISLGSNFGSHGLPSSMSGSVFGSGSESPVFGSEIDISILSRAQAANPNGFTPLEQQLILQAQAHAQAQQLQADSEARRINAAFPRSSGSANGSKLNVSGAKEFVPRGLLSRMQQSQGQSQDSALGNGTAYSLNSLAGLSPLNISEADFHAQSGQQRHQRPQQQQQQRRMTTNSSAGVTISDPLASFNAKDARPAFGSSHDRRSSQRSDMEDARMSSSLDYNNRVDAPRTRTGTESVPSTNQAVHVRSTTLPGTFMLASGAKSPKPTVAGMGTRASAAGEGNKSMSAAMESSGATDSQADSPILIPSPALTYNSSNESSASRTPSTLSPSTPFFGFNSPQQQARDFDGPRKEETMGSSSPGPKRAVHGEEHAEGENMFSVGRETAVRDGAQ